MKKILVNRFDHAPNDGMSSMNATLTFRALDIGMWTSPKYSNICVDQLDETLSNETDVPGVASSDLSDITIKIYRYRGFEIKYYSHTLYQRKLKDYQDSMLKQAKAIDENSFSKHGITHAVG